MDVTFNLRNGSYQPYKTSNDDLKYISDLSNHPPKILKQLTTTISDKLLRNSLSELIFNESKHQYENALSKSGFKTELTYKDHCWPRTFFRPPLTPPTIKKMISKKRKIIWFNPPYNQNVLTNIAKINLKLVDKHFRRTHRLRKIFNCITIKVSYSWINNVQQLIKKHSNFIQNKKNTASRNCNCRDKNGCPLNGNCKTKNVIYKCSLLTKNNAYCLLRCHRRKIQELVLTPSTIVPKRRL